MKNYLTFIGAYLLFTSTLFAQPECPPGVPPSEECQNTCIFCNIDGLTSTNNGVGSNPNTICGQIAVHNPQWWGFQGGTASMTVNIETSNCQNGDGLQVAIFDDCGAPDAIICNPGIPGGGGQPLFLTYDNFVPGKNYFLMVDGWSSDVCDYKIQVVDGATAPCADLVTVCDTNCVSMCDSVFCGEGLHTAVCQGSDPIQFYLHIARPHAEIAGNTSITCFQTGAILEAISPKGSIQWLNSSGQPVGYGSSVSLSSADWYTLKVTDGPCTDEDKAFVKDLRQNPNISAKGCTLDPSSGTCKLTANCVLSPVTYTWFGPNGFTSNKKNPVVSIAGTYTLLVNVSNTGCFSTMDVEVVH